MVGPRRGWDFGVEPLQGARPGTVVARVLCAVCVCVWCLSYVSFASVVCRRRSLLRVSVLVRRLLARSASSIGLSNFRLSDENDADVENQDTATGGKRGRKKRRMTWIDDHSSLFIIWSYLLRIYYLTSSAVLNLSDCAARRPRSRLFHTVPPTTCATIASEKVSAPGQHEWRSMDGTFQPSSSRRSWTRWTDAPVACSLFLFARLGRSCCPTTSPLFLSASPSSPSSPSSSRRRWSPRCTSVRRAPTF